MKYKDRKQQQNPSEKYVKNKLIKINQLIQTKLNRVRLFNCVEKYNFYLYWQGDSEWLYHSIQLIKHSFLIRRTKPHPCHSLCLTDLIGHHVLFPLLLVQMFFIEYDFFVRCNKQSRGTPSTTRPLSTSKFLAGVKYKTKAKLIYANKWNVLVS